MGLIKLDQASDHRIKPEYSSGTGPVLRSEKLELTKAFYPQGTGTIRHVHPEEQIVYVLSGRARITVGDEQYEVGPGDASFHPSNVPHGLEVLEDLTALSIKGLVDPTLYAATGSLE